MYTMPTLRLLSEISMQAVNKEVRLAGKIVATLVRDKLHYPGRLIAESLTMAVRCGVLLILYWYVFNLRGGEINNTTFAPVAWSMFFYFAFSALRLRDISRVIMQDVQSGSIEQLFSKPISYILYRCWWQIGDGLYPFTVATAFGSIILLLLVGLPESMAIGLFLPTLLLALLGATALSLILYMIVGLFAFWIEEVTPLHWIVDKAIMILGGSYLPIALFPEFMYKIAIYSPFGASKFVTHTVTTSWQSNWYILVSIQVFWIVLLGICLYWMFRRARLKVSVNGG